MYCTVCEKIRGTHIRVSKPRYFMKCYEEAQHLEYHREVCLICQSPLLIKDEPNFEPHIKVSKKDKQAEKRFNQRMMRVTNWPEMK